MPDVSPEPAVDLSRLAPSLGSTCEEYLTRYRTAFAEAVRRGDSGVATARALSNSLDGLLGALFCASDAATRAAGLPVKGRLGLVAYGGYGRGTVGLYSDLDVLFLCDDPTDPRVAAIAEAMLYPLWDLKVDIGHAVRGVDETIKLARTDIRTATSLLDLRRVGGDAEIVKELLGASRRQVFEPALGEFLDALVADTETRHERFGGSLYLLEPDVKHGRGGLRDLDVAEWAGRAGWGVRTTEDLVRIGAVLPREVKAIEAAREMLWRVRNFLHVRAGRRQDRLTFSDQEDIAAELGFVDGVTLGVEQFMQAYYRHARTVAQMAERMVERARPRKRRHRARTIDLGDGTIVFDEAITFEKSERLADDPALALRLYRQVAKQKKPPYPYARDAIASQCADRAFRGRLMRSEEATQLFVSLLMCTDDVPVRNGSLLGELHEVGILQAMVPEFEPLLGRVHHDVYHVYTVDVHTVLAVDRLRSLFRGEQTTGLGLACRLAADSTRHAALYVAVLLHAIGKAHGRDQDRRGAEIARGIAERFGLSAVDVDYVSFLVREQMTLYRFATQRDTYDAETTQEVARLVKSTEQLRDLYLVTVSILSTINPNAMTHWKSRLLEELYLNVVAILDGEGKFRETETGVAAIRAEARKQLEGEPGGAELEAFLEEMPDRYLLGHPVEVLARHARLARDRREQAVAVALARGPGDEITEVVVATKDRPGLLSDVAAVLAANRLGIMGAEIYTRACRSGLEAFDVFLVAREWKGATAADRTLEQNLTQDLVARLEGRVTPEDLLARNRAKPSWAQRKSPDVPTEVMVDNETSSRFTVVDVFTRDRLGLLHVISRTLFELGLSIALSKVNTEGQRVADVFYVQDEKGAKVRDEGRVRRIQEALRERIDALHASAQEGAKA